ncbi:MAG: IclR family transcriptional regulator [Actinomycetales bacterium]|nr:IclR family transcriptional regulator [Actinomycetales bacterium]
MNPRNDDRRTDEVAVLTKAMAILTSLAAEGPSTVVRICEFTGVTKPTAYRILKTFEVGGYVIRDDARREYRIGPALYGMSRALRSEHGLLQLARPIMQELNESLGETVNIGVLNNLNVIYLDSIESAQRLKATVQVATKEHLHSTALGKAILACLPDDEARQLLEAADRPQLTPGTVTSVDELMKQIQQIRSQGYSVDDEENEVGSRCVGAAITDVSGHALAAISVTAPTSRMNAREMVLIGSTVHRACAELSAMI